MLNKDDIRIGAAYIRVSTDDQMDLSPESQLESVLAYAKEHNIVIPADYIFQESEGRSGKKADNRPQFQRMIATAKMKPKPFDCVLVWKFSRFARNQDESTFYKGMLRKKLGIDVISISEPVLDGMYGRLIEMIIEWQDEFYSYNLAQDVKRGMKTNAQNGWYQCRPPLGYRIPHHRALPEIVPEEAEIVRMIFDKYVNEKMSIFELTRYCNSLGLKTSRGKPFEKRSLEYILRNPAYAGIVRWNMTCNETKQIRDKSEWIIAKGEHPAIISEELFNQASERYESEYKRKNARPAENSKHWLSGLIKCSSCGRTLSSCVRVGKRVGPSFSFQCYGFLKGKCTASHYVSEKDLVPAIMTSLNEVLESGNIDYEVQKPAPAQDHTEAAALHARLKRLDQKESRIKDAYMDGIDTLEEYKQNRQLIQNERESILELLRQNQVPEDPDRQKEAMLANIRSVLDILASDQFTTAQKNAAMKSIISKIVYDRDKHHIDIYYILGPSGPGIPDK